ncbi:histone-lysine N-methyltransferase trithorax [Venturia canescens]|uniref:histone-lysine N-methyltransferase trithorax n=1 Tax=Venturia canescens TaxID=32260 RepID=UPI001C9D459B|nr:histone-lysine N-methyltransferase trithorax [Venturia canescens]
MGRSKFPGKPPKTVTRKRIKVLGRPEANQSDSVTVAENIYYGLSLFNETFGDNEKEHPPFHGFSTNEAKLSVSYVKTQQRDVASTQTSVQKVAMGKKEEEKISCEIENIDSDKKERSENSETKPLVERVTVIEKERAEMEEASGKQKCSMKDVKFDNMMKVPVLKSVNNILDRHQRTRQLRNSTAKRLLQRAKTNNGIGGTRAVTIQCGDKTNSVRKFVLPVRSVHSSRVIKPNKRFIEELEDSLSNDHCENETGKNLKKAKIIQGKNKAASETTAKESPAQMDDKETKNKLKRVSYGESCDKKTENEASRLSQDAPTSKDSQNEVKKSQVKVTSKTWCNTTSFVQDSFNRTADLVGKIDEAAKLSDKQISVPSKVLPDCNVPNFESSRVQTRSGTLSETSNVSHLKPDPPCEPNEERANEDLGNCTRTSEKNAATASKENESEVVGIVSKSKCSHGSESESSLSESGSEHDDHSEDEQSEWTGMKMNGGKVILRKARLKLDNKTPSGTEGPFSTTNNNVNATGNSNQGPTATVKCGVCGAVRFYRFVKQARKFGIYSCESCRKFISKMIKRQACAKSSNNTLPILQCHKGDGLCLVPPVVRSQQWNLMRCVYKARCPACWLKMCLKCYNIPSSLRTGLYSLLPPLMRDPVISLSLGPDDCDVLANNKSIGGKICWPAEDCLEKNLFKSAMSWSNIEIGRKPSYHDGNVGGLLAKKSDKFDYPTSISPTRKRKNDNRIKVRKKMKNPLLPPSAINQSPQSPRQRINLKGPRVKHVCRSASVALGQPLATFPSVDGKDADNECSGKVVAKVAKDEGKFEKKSDEAPKEKENNSQKSNQENVCAISTNISVQTSCGKRTKSHQSVLAPNHQVVRSLPKPRIDAVHTISIDFWEQYDPVEVGSKGFALIASEPFHIPAVCFLCGSGGREPLIHCQCCCEPYHAFCLEPSEWNACAQPSWCCPRCTICQNCRLRSGPKLSCIRCRQSFHHSCLSKSGVSARLLYSPDRPYVCQSCIKCKSCGSEGVNVHVGNLPLCSMCFKLRQRGNYCPLCQRCYNENDFDTKMMECNECSCWVHARCEGLSAESYQILSYLPDSIEFTCSQCSPQPNSVWRTAIESELKAGLNAVIKALSRNRKACAALKWSPRKECHCRPVGSARKLEFSDLERYKNEEESEDCSSDKSTDTSGTVLDSKSDGSSRTRSECDPEDQTSEVPRRGLRRLRQKFHSKECSVRINKNGNSREAQDPGTQDSSDSRECRCSEQQIVARPSPSLMSIKRKVNSNEYTSLVQFYCDMEHVVSRVGGQELVDALHKSLQEIFPWFDPKSVEFGSSSNGEGAKDGTKKLADLSPTKLDDSILETWREEVLKAPKAIAAKTGNLYGNLHSEDSRSCCLCKGLSDGQETKEGRLLYCGQNEWVHSNCALWSNEVFEEIDGSLQNVHSAISRSRLIRCTECGKKGASIGCCSKNCNNTFHFPCARSIGLAFNDDKTVFCILHLANCTDKTAQNEADFDLRRNVYVELDRKKKKYAEPDKVKVMIGSLTVDCLGSIVPEFSDTRDKILPTNYRCSRLYWSTVNPMKIVRYYIRTYVQMYVPDTCVEAENNVTIDHSREREKEEERAMMDNEKREKLAVKQTLESLIDAVCNREVDENLAEQNNTDLLPPEIKDAIFEDLPHDLLDGISMQDIFPKMTYEDFLAMDLKSDGVFGQDLLKDEILQAEVEDIMKPPESKISKVDVPISESVGQNDFWFHLEAKGSVQDFMDDLLSAKSKKIGGRELKSQKIGGRELKRSKSEVMTNNPLVVGGQRHHQRSCSLTWSCKLDGTYGPTMKRRKLPRPTATTRSGEANVMLVDPANVERASLFHELRIPESIMVTVGRASTPSILSETYRVPSPRDESKDHKRLLWQHTRQQPRILQVDGPADPSSASECSSPEYNIEERIGTIGTGLIPQVDGTNDESSCENSEWYSYKERLRSLSTDSASSSETADKSRNSDHSFAENEDSEDGIRIPQLDGADDISSDEESLSPRAIESETSPSTSVPISDPIDRPVTCKRCKCTYRTRDSYDRHLSNCDIVTTSDSDSETMDNKGASPDSRFSPSIGAMSPQFVIMSPSEGHTMSSEYPDTQVTSPLEASVASPHPAIHQIEPIAQAIITPQIHTHATVETLHRTVLTSNDMIVQTQYTRTTTTLPNPVLPQESTVRITEIPDSPPPPSETSSSASPDSLQTSLERCAPQTTQNSRVIGQNCSAMPSSESAPQANLVPTVRTSKPKSPRVTRPRAKVIKPNVRNALPPQQHTNQQMRYQPMQTTPPVLQLQQQRASGPTVILQQVPAPGMMSAYVETLQQQTGQNVQYITALPGQQEASYKPQFIATNQLVPGAYIQTASDNLLALQNGGISVLPGVQIAPQQQPTVLGTIIQQQPSAIQCGVISSEQLVLSSTPTLEMFSDSTGSMFVSSQPMYYGLETIVSNTVMSSSQFMTGAVPQVLASSYQTTTQVFQASKLMEPMLDVQTLQNTVPAVQAVQGVPHGSYVVMNQSAPAPEPMPRPPPPNPQPPPPPPPLPPSRINLPSTGVPDSTSFVIPPCDNIPQHNPSHPGIEATRSPTMIDIRPIQQLPYVESTQNVANPAKPMQQTISSIPRVAVKPSPATHNVNQMNHAQWKVNEPSYAEQSVDKTSRPYFDSKHVSENTSMIKSSVNTKIPPLQNIMQRNAIVSNKLSCEPDSGCNNYINGITNVCNNVVVSPGINNLNSVVPSGQNKLTIPPTSAAPPCRPMNRVLPMQAVVPKLESVKPVEKREIVIEEPTKPVIKSPTPEPEESVKSVVKIDPPTESIEPVKEKKDIEKAEIIEPVVESPEPLKEEMIVPVEPPKENVKLDLPEEKEPEKSESTPLKMVLQKQVEDGSYKIAQNMKPPAAACQNKNPPKITSVEILTAKQAPQIASLQLLPIKTFTLKANKTEEPASVTLPKARPPPIAVKKPRFVAKTGAANTLAKKDPPVEKTTKKTLTGPSLMYEIKSQDGFTHTASSMAEVWETVFQAVQNARKAHNLPPLAHNPLTEGLGLDNNATIYLVEQLAGVNRCTKYKPKFHDLKPPNKTRDLDSESFAECESGAARAEPFKGRKVHDVFSWLASRHRRQPKMIAISETEMRRAASTNLPMAMRFRVLKETSKESVGVYHSHIHGRGLFCLRDIEAGEMVIEYAGEVIRASLTDKREKYYDSKNIGCYMFKIDDHLVVDATMKGNAARFINHSCEPNCYSRVVDILGKKHILIFALRRIVQGEELTYDYKFPFEDIKIPCTCGSRRCRKYLN